MTKVLILMQQLSRWIGRVIAAFVRWDVQVQPPPSRCVIIGAPHTSNWDLPVTLMMMLAANLKLRWIAKDTLFRGPFGWLLRSLGGIPVNRRSRNNFVDQMADALQSTDALMIGLLPEGTRSVTPYWKTGFYYIALKAGVPIVLGFADYRRRVVGLGPLLYPSGDIHADFAIIRDFYTGITGKHPERQGIIQLQAPDQAN